MEHAIERAKQHGITGITWSLTQGVVKNIIPAIASTNAIIAAACTQEAFKIATSTAPYLNNYMMYAGNDGMYTYTFEYAKRIDCPVCGGESRTITLASTDTLTHLVDLLRDLPDMYVALREQLTNRPANANGLPSRARRGLCTMPPRPRWRKPHAPTWTRPWPSCTCEPTT